MDLTRRSLLASLAAAGLFPGVARGALGAKNLIVVLAYGGWDVTYCMDPRLGDPEVDDARIDEDWDDPDDREGIETIHGLPVLVNDVKRPAVRDFFAEWGSRVAIVNGIWTGSLVHEPSLARVLSGRRTLDGPDLSVITGHVHGVGSPLGSLDLSGRSLSGSLGLSSGRVGYRQQLRALVDPSASYAGLSTDYLPDVDDQAAVRAFVSARTDGFAEASGASALSEQLHAAAARAEQLQADPTLVGALTLGNTTGYMKGLDIAVDALKAGLCRAAIIDDGGTWDTHPGNSKQHDLYQGHFVGLSKLARELELAGLLDDTVVLSISEMTRTPRFNERLGKDHWPHTSAILFGGPIVGGRVRGGTAGPLLSQPVDLKTGVVDPAGDLLRFDNLVAGILEAVGIGSQEWLPGVTPFGGLLV